MNFEKWEPFYIEILRDFGYSRAEDERSARLLDSLLAGERAPIDYLRDLLEGEAVSVLGNAPSLGHDIGKVKGCVIAADEATTIAMDRGTIPDIIVTDLDGNVFHQVKCNEKGSVAVIHAHGDNMEALVRWAPLFRGKVLATTQSKPFGEIYNFGGFTDGDRAVLLADHFGAKEIRLLGFNFENPNPKDENREAKKRKLGWARRLIDSLQNDRIIL